jgi:hypothetical protein
MTYTSPVFSIKENDALINRGTFSAECIWLASGKPHANSHPPSLVPRIAIGAFSRAVLVEFFNFFSCYGKWGPRDIRFEPIGATPRSRQIRVWAWHNVEKLWSLKDEHTG